MVQSSAGTARLAAGGSLLAGGLASLALAVALGARLALTGWEPVLRIDEVVERGILALGLGAAAWLALSCLVGALCVGVRGVGTTWRTGERAVQRYAPALVRRALGVGIAASLAVGLASGAGAAAPRGDATPVGDPSGVGVAVDLGWAVPERSHATGATATADDRRAAEPPAPGTGEPRGTDLGWVVSGSRPPAAEAAATASPAPASTAVPERTRSSPAPPARDTAGTAASGAEPSPAAPAPRSSVPRTVGPASGHPSTASERADDRVTSPASVTVRVGDSLWTIAEAHLAADGGADPSDAQVAAAWPDWYAANAKVIGGDPDTIRAGQRLVVPTSTARPGR